MCIVFVIQNWYSSLYRQEPRSTFAPTSPLCHWSDTLEASPSARSFRIRLAAQGKGKGQLLYCSDLQHCPPRYLHPQPLGHVSHEASGLWPMMAPQSNCPDILSPQSISGNPVFLYCSARSRCRPLCHSRTQRKAKTGERPGICMKAT